MEEIGNEEEELKDEEMDVSSNNIVIMGIMEEENEGVIREVIGEVVEEMGGENNEVRDVIVHPGNIERLEGENKEVNEVIIEEEVGEAIIGIVPEPVEEEEVFESLEEEFSELIEEEFTELMAGEVSESIEGESSESIEVEVTELMEGEVSV